MTFPKLSGAEIDVLYKLYRYASQVLTLDFDDVPSKSGRNALIEKGYATAAFKSPNENTDMCLLITPLGIDAYKYGIETEWH
ncbi:hypothetical protein Lw1_gp126 [Escherichia phage Lw1]|uniref:Uncharacterized protein n=1 Tax=Escherichia phage Lw1 TaxID=1307804 RepID=M9V177_9CAUD|nr:hypothetical protein Lw1_gp126 [Escherichia phage Lw1]AGJ71534.1 hypothetical protein Lw1_gp126 [Escherichia phage Lw1]